MATSTADRKDSQILQGDIPRGRVRLYHDPDIPLRADRFPRMLQRLYPERAQASPNMEH